VRRQGAQTRARRRCAARSGPAAAGSPPARPATAPPPTGGGPAADWARCHAERSAGRSHAGVAPAGNAGSRTPCRRAAWRALDRRDGIHQALQQLGIVGVGGRQPNRQGDATTVDQQMVLGPGLARSVGFGPVSSPPAWHARSRCPGWRGTSRAGRRGQAGPAAPGAAAARPRRIPQPPPAGDGAAAAELTSGEQPPEDASTQLVDDADKWARSLMRGRPP
jgi:hypothetical protein